MALNDRKGGMVVRVRVNPKDCLGILDVVRKAGVDPRVHSFSACAAIALSSLIGIARKSGIIAGEEDGFQYFNRMEMYLNQPSTLAKRNRTNQLYEEAQRDIVAPEPVIQETFKVMDRDARLLLGKEMEEIDDRRVNERFLNAADEARYMEINNLLFT